jgi:uncharacterized protein (DUF2336 family)
MMTESQSLIAELDANLSKASSAQQLTVLRRVTDLFLDGREEYAADHVAVFDDVIGWLLHRIEKVERPGLVELSSKLAPVDNAPIKVIDRLARHEDIAISGPVLQRSPVVTEQALAEVAGAKGDKHLSAIAGRPQISESVTDILVGRCTPEIARKVTDNKGANLSEVGFVKLINRAKSDKALATAIESRGDLPPELQPFLKLALS